MKIVKDWWYVLKVCHKYKIRWWPFSKMGHGTYHSYNFWLKGPTIFVNLFDKHLIEIFLHEVGHHVAERVGYLEKYRKYLKETPKDEMLLFKGRSYAVVLQEEAFASRFAGKARKGLDSPQMVKWFQTYVHAGYESPYIKDKISFTDDVYKLIRRIENVQKET